MATAATDAAADRPRAARHRELSRRSSAGRRHGRAAARKVLDVGCGDGDLLQLLESRGIDGRGIELSREGVNRCVAKGLAVVQGDADTDLVNYPDDAFDYVILSQTLQATRQPKAVLENLLRIGRRAIVSFPNFGFWKMRLQLLVGGHMPRTENLPATWYDTPNIHFCTIKDFVQLCDEINVKMERAVALDLYGRPVPLNLPWWVWNMFGEQGVFLLSRGGKTKRHSERRSIQSLRRRADASAICHAAPGMTANDEPPPSTADRAPATGPASTSAMNRSTISLNSAGSSRLSTWPDLRKEREPRRRQMLLQEQARLDAIVVLVAADDQRRRRHFPDRIRHGVDRGPAALKAAHGVGRALGVVPRQRGVEIGVAARVLHQEGNPARRLARDLRDFDRADLSRTARRWPGIACGRRRDFPGWSRSRRRPASSTARGPAH